MSDHVDGDGPALARDAAGVTRLTDEQALRVARWYLDLDAGSDALPDGVTLGTAHDGAMAWIVAAAPVVAAARAWYDAPNDYGSADATRAAVDALAAAVRALDGDA